MQSYKYVIVGGGIAGTTAAEVIRKNDEDGKIAIVSDEPHTLYSRVLLSKPKWLLGEQPFDNVWLKDDDWYTENNIHLFKGIRADNLNPSEKTIELSDGDKLKYEKLLLATGAHARKWNVKGADKKGVYYLRTVDDAKSIGNIAKGEPKSVVMIGSSCVSFEIIEILNKRGFEVIEVMREKYFFEPQLSQDEVAPIEKTLEESGVKIIRESEVEEVLGNESVEGVRLKDGREIKCDIVLPFIGVELPVKWINDAGVATHKGIYANKYLETNVPDIWTAGDTSENWDEVLGETVIMGNWMSARLQGEIAGNNMSSDIKRPFEQVSFHTSHGFGFQIGWAGDTRVLDDREVLHYPTKEENTYCRIIIRKNRVVGGTVVNRPDLLSAIVKAIKAKINITDAVDDLKNGSVNLKDLV